MKFKKPIVAKLFQEKIYLGITSIQIISKF